MPTKNDIIKINKLFKNGYRWNEIGDKIGVSASTAWRWHRDSRNSIPSPNKRVNKSTKDAGNGRKPKNETVKAIGNKILKYARRTIQQEAGLEKHVQFATNRWVYQRMAIDEQKSKKEIKKLIWDKRSRICRICNVNFDSLTGLHLHRTDDSKGYSEENCELLHEKCHKNMSSVFKRA